MKYVFNFFRAIIIIYLILYIFARVILYADERKNNQLLPTIIKGMTVYKVEGTSLSPEAPKDRYVIIKKTTKYQEGDLIIYNNGARNVIAKITSRNKYIYTITDENGSILNLTDKDILAKVIKNNKKLSFVITVLTNYVVLVILLFVGTILPELLFDN